MQENSLGIPIKTKEDFIIELTESLKSLRISTKKLEESLEDFIFKSFVVQDGFDKLIDKFK